MSKPSDRQATSMDTEALARDWIEIASKSNLLVDALLKNQSGDATSGLFDVEGVTDAFVHLGQKMMSDPQTAARAQMEFWQGSFQLWQSTMLRMTGQQAEPVIKPEKGDRRFADSAWSEDPAFDHLKQSYLLASRWVQTVVNEVEGLNERERRKVDFFTRQFVSAMAPTNFATMNPVVVRETMESGGQNLVTGMKHMLADIQRGNGQLKISMTDESAFELGKNVATTPGKVVFQNDLIQLIQYDPSTPDVHKRPMLFVPPWINKFYILDLQSKNSLIKWVVDQGHTLFVISWANPTQLKSDKTLTDYMLDGPMAAIDAIEKATGEKSINLLGFCIGGILSTAMLAYMAEVGDERVNSATFLTTMVDFEDVGEISVFIDDQQLQLIEDSIGRTGYLEGKRLANIFSMMRENDLIWSFYVNNYLRGKQPMAFDMLYWNSDSTALPAKMLSEYVRQFYIDNGLRRPGYIKLNDTPIDISKITIPCYSLATREDHIAPWVSCFPITKLFSGSVRFVLGASGHIAGVVNPPAKKKYCYWTNDRKTTDAQDWLETAQQHGGSWWTDWGEWLAAKGGPRVPARQPGDGKLDTIEDAPGSYVKVRGSE